jgi:hypothetical protein
MAWTPKGTWPIKAGDDKTYAVFEDLRKIIWFYRFGMYGKPLPEYDYPNYDPTFGNYSAGDSVYYDGWLWTCILPYPSGTEMAQVMPKGLLPGTNKLWARTARYWVYSDFYPNTDCCIVSWCAQAITGKEWQKWPAWRELPACLNKYVQQQAWHDGKVVPAETVYGTRQEKPIEQLLYWKDLVQIITGRIGSQFREYHSVIGSPVPSPWYWPYFVLSGNGGGIDNLINSRTANPYYDKKLEGYQSSIESVLEKGGFYWPIPKISWEAGKQYKAGDYVYYEHIFYGCSIDHISEAAYPPDGSGGWPAFSALWFEAQGSHLPLNDAYWKCNLSAFEAALMFLGNDENGHPNYDWYLDTSFPPDPLQLRRRGYPWYRKACWRKMWKYSFGFPGTSLISWPSEFGDPPFLNESDDWWAWNSNIGRAFNTALSALVFMQESREYRDWLKRHLPYGSQTFRLKDDQFLNKNIYPNEGDIFEVKDQFGNTIRGYDALYFELPPQLMNHMRLVTDKARVQRIDVSTQIWQREVRSTLNNALECSNPHLFYDKWMTARGDVMDFSSKYEELDHYGNMINFESCSQDTGYVGYEDNSHTPHLSRISSHFTSLEGDNKVGWFYNANAMGYTAIWKRYFAVAFLDITDELKKMLLAGGITHIICDVVINGGDMPNGAARPDTDTEKYNYHKVVVSKPNIGLEVSGGSFTPDTHQVVEFPIASIDDRYRCGIRDLNELAWPGEWSKPAPTDLTKGYNAFSAFGGSLRIRFLPKEIYIVLNSLKIDLGGPVVE